MKCKLASWVRDYSSALIYAALILFAIAATALSASAPGPVRLARALPPSAVSAHERAERHNQALRALLEETGIPAGSDPSNVVKRTEALELINWAITNAVELADGSASADEVADAAGDYVARYILGKTNDSERVTVSAVKARSSQWTKLRSAWLADHPRCAACGARATVVHHVIPVQFDPSRELNTNNLISFCDRCHLVFGHLGDWRSYNSSCRKDAAAWLARCKARPYKLQVSPEILVVGDSHAANRLPHSGVDAWIVADILGAPASNRLAVSGSTAAQWSADYRGWLTAATNNRAPVVWISLGGNDALSMLSAGFSPAAVSAAQSNYCAVVRSVGRGRRLVIATTYADPFQGARTDYAFGVTVLNSMIRLLTAKATTEIGVPFAVLDEPSILTGYDFDGSGDLHPNPTGYTNMGLRARAIIKEEMP